MDSMPNRNPFLAAQTAQNYAHARPNYHPDALAVAVRLLDLPVPVGVAVDMGCGTGMSSRALADVADRVVGLDVSRPMLGAAEPQAGVHYLQAAAERLPLRSEIADLGVTAAAFHWFDQEAMLTDAARVLRPGGGFVVYTDFFSGLLDGGQECSAWLSDTYRPRFPAPPRRDWFDRDLAESAGLRFVGSEQLAHRVPMTAGSLIDYLLSQSGATSALDEGRVTIEGLGAWLREELGRRLPNTGPVPVQFTGTVWCCRKSA